MFAAVPVAGALLLDEPPAGGASGVKGEGALPGFCACSCCESGGESSEVKCVDGSWFGGVAGDEAEESSCIGESRSSGHRT